MESQKSANELDETTKKLIDKVKLLEVKLTEKDATILQLEDQLANLKSQILGKNRKYLENLVSELILFN